MATFSVRFLGCKVSQTDAHAIRERLLADGHVERDGEAGCDVAVVNTCCVTHEAVRKSRHAAARLARTHRRVFVTGCGANLAGDAFAGLAENADVREVCQGTNKKNNRQYYLDRLRKVGDMHGQAPVLWCATALLRD